MLRRTADDDDPYERPIVANADQLVIVTALADPPPRTGHDRPHPGGRLRRRTGAAALPDQGRPGRARRPARRSTPRSTSPSRVTRPGADLTELRDLWTGIAASSSATPASASRRLVNAPDPGRQAGHRRGERGDRPRPAHLDVAPSRCACPDTATGLGDRHPGRPLLRAEPRPPGPDRGRLRRPGGHRRRLPARVHAHRRRARVRAGRRGRRAANCPPARLESFRRMLGSGQ